MHRIIKAAAVAVAVLIPTAAMVGTGSSVSASVSYDDSYVGFVGKGDVQTPLGMNNKQLQDAVKADETIPDTIQFTHKLVTSTDWGWTCSNGDEHVNRWIVTVESPLNTAVARENSHGKDGPVTGFWLQGKTGSSTVTGTGARMPNFQCDNGGSVTNPQSSYTHYVAFNGVQLTVGGTTIDLPETPVEAPVVVPVA